ncbi:Arylsulfatase [Aquisphaera giovannonii]|uniref:Arylsulfatase n=1 Tax=Aquisphaera giovannonii TaxID=406548 RepID=A0A5B9W6W7_9BACT|nr:sulfatase-like hydrolase/transferase [Aquisphaera giovannonii]QEH36353.1 Arylsulfatase [Aquisphaera giovannonii]
MGPVRQGSSRSSGPSACVAALGLAAAVLAASGCPTSGQRRVAQGPAEERPNLLIIVSDDQSGLCLGAAGDPRGATPNLDRLAAQGVFFARAFCNAPVCTASRQSFITGKLPHAVGVTRLGTPLPDDARTLGTWLGENGYRTAAIGKMHFNGPSHHGFDARIDVGEWLRHLRESPPPGGDHRRPWRPFVDPPDAWLNARCRDEGLPEGSTASTFFIDRALEFARREDERPFAMVVSLYEPHAPFRFPREWRGRYRPDQFPVPPATEAERRDAPRVFRQLTGDDLRGIQAAYYTSLSFMDHQVGRLLRGLDEGGLGEKTLVVFLSDNGYLLGQHGRVEKNCFYEPAVRVPLMLRWPGKLPAGRKVADLVELVDLFPTLCRLIDIPEPAGLQGMDLSTLARGAPGASGRPAVFSEYNESEEAMIRTPRHKLILGTGRRARRDHLEADAPAAGPYVRLFDLESDPEEKVDLGADPALEALRRDLIGAMHDRFARSWTGPDPIPAGLPPRDAIEWCLSPRDP